jgi:hypothetical protein
MRLVGAAFCMVSFAVLVWPVSEMWWEAPRQWDRLAPAAGVMAFMFILAVALVITGLREVSRRRPAKTATEQPARHARRRKPAVDASPDVPEEAPVPVAPEATLEAMVFVYPEPADSLPPAFRKMVQMIREYGADQDVVAEMERVYEIARHHVPFQRAEDFVLRKAEDRPEWDAEAYAQPINPGNPALFYDEAHVIHPLAGTVLAMVLIAEQLPAEVWDRIEKPWVGAELELPEVVLAG